MSYGSIEQTKRRCKKLGYQNFAVTCGCLEGCRCVTEWGDRNDELLGNGEYELLDWDLKRIVQDEVDR